MIFNWLKTALLPAATVEQPKKEKTMAKSSKKPVFTWGYEFSNGSYYTEFFGTKKAAKTYSTDFSFNDDFKIVKFVVKKVSAK